MVREGFIERSNISQPNDDKWMMLVPPVVGVERHGIYADKICWTIEERPRDVGSDQFYHLNIHTTKCAKDELSVGAVLCTDYQNNKQTIQRCIESDVNMRENGVDPNMRSMVLDRSMTLQKQSKEYHRNESGKKSKKIAREIKLLIS